MSLSSILICEAGSLWRLRFVLGGLSWRVLGEHHSHTKIEHFLIKMRCFWPIVLTKQEHPGWLAWLGWLAGWAGWLAGAEAGGIGLAVPRESAGLSWL